MEPNNKNKYNKLWITQDLEWISQKPNPSKRTVWILESMAILYALHSQTSLQVIDYVA